MKKNSALLVMLICCYCSVFANTFVSNTSNSFTLNSPCGPLTNGTYTVQLNYFDFNIGDWVPGPDHTAFTTYTGVVVTVNTTTMDVVYNFAGASPAVNFPANMGDAQGWIKVTSAGMQMNWDNHQLNCPSLPVTLISFSGTPVLVGGKYQINFAWSTATEQNSCIFVVERYTNNVWTPLCRIAAAGESQIIRNYSFNFLYPPLGFGQYRLKMIDIDNSFTYSQVVANTLSCSGGGSACIRSTVPCSFTISGASSFCTGSQTYSLSAGSSAGVLWTLSPAGYPGTLSLNECGNTATISKVGNGQVTLTASILGCTNTFSKVVQLGAISTFTYTLNTGLINASATQWGYSSYQWVLNLGSKGTFTFTGPSLYYQMPPCSGGVLTLNVVSPCGPGSSGVTVWNTNCSSFRVGPTKTTDRISIRQENVESAEMQKMAAGKGVKVAKESIKELIIYDTYMNVRMRNKYPANTTMLDLDVSSIQPGNYILEISTESGKQTEKIQIVR